jgi:hypothetical protein
MPYRRAAYVLTPPTWPIFAISLVLALIALLVRYGGVVIPIINAGHVFDVLAIAYLVLVLGVLLRRF